MQLRKHLLLSATLAAAAGACSFASTPAQARVHVDIYANVAPPPLRVEVAPAPRRGYVWVPGYWGWSHHRHSWNRGHWVRERHGYHWAPARWDQDGNRWRYRQGRWEH